MVAVIKASNSIRNALQYNERKLKAGVAELIHSANYGKDTDRLGFTDKIRRLQRLAVLNPRTKVNSVHISLNFDPSEALNKDTLQRIADSYMEKIGFGEQPYLVYQHRDAGHPHIHIVTTNIRADGSRIKLHNIGRDRSEPARKEIEQEFRLVKAEGRALKEAYRLKSVSAEEIQYGRSATKRAITNVLDAIIPVYKYASLPQLNAVLQQYNVLADRGGEKSRIYQRRGLVYRVLDARGQKVGVPIKASDIYSKPTLKALEKNFEKNAIDREPYKQRIKKAIDGSFLVGKPKSIPQLTALLKLDNIQLVTRQNDQGVVYGMTYVDHQTKCVFNGSELGKEYSSNAIQYRCRQDLREEQRPVPEVKPTIDAVSITSPSHGKVLLAELLEPEKDPHSLPYELRMQKKKRKRKRLHH